jgi:hypothetical protein
MARKKAESVAEMPTERVLAFRAPDVVHGALKQIVGRLEMASCRVDGKNPSGQDVLNWMIGELYMQGPDKWAERIESAHTSYQAFTSQN